MLQEPALLMVTCCLEETRYNVLREVVNNIIYCCPSDWRSRITVFDNASTYPQTLSLLSGFDNVFVANRNVGYWSAIDWWLQRLEHETPGYTYVIESDMVHYRAAALDDCVTFLDEHPELGSMRLLEYSVADKALYDKDTPIEGSRRNHWQSHVNRVTGKPVVHEHVVGPYWRSNFLTQLPALNRYDAMKRCFNELRKRPTFTEPDFQQLYHTIHPQISLLDGGMFNCNMTHGNVKIVSASWTDPERLVQLGYSGTRTGTIVPIDQYKVIKLS